MEFEEVINEIIEVAKVAYKHYDEGKPWITDIIIRCTNPFDINIVINRECKVKLKSTGQVGTVYDITHSEDGVCYVVDIDGISDCIFVLADDIEAYEGE